MGFIKGQNLRLLIDGACVGSALTCTLHVGTQIEDNSTKDSAGKWVENILTGLNWDASAEAVVTDGKYSETNNVRTFEEISGGGFYESTQSFRLEPGQTIYVAAVSGVKVSMNNSHQSPLIEPVSNTADYTNEGSVAMNIYLLSDTLGAKLDVYITDEERIGIIELYEAMAAGTLVSVRFSTTNGRNNVVEDEALYEGSAYINDISVNAPNRERSTYNIQLIGKGPLEPVDE